MGYLYLSIVLVIFAIIYYNMFSKDILSISFVSCAVHALSSFAAFVSCLMNSWNRMNLQPQTALYIIIAMLSIGVGEYVINSFVIKNNENKKEIRLIRINTVKIIICTVFVLITIVLVFNNLVDLTKETGIGAIINTYKVNSAMYSQNEDIMKINFIYTQMYRFSIAIGIVFLYIYINNICYNWKLKYNFRFLIPIFFSMVLSILLGGRSSLMRFIVATFIFYIIIFQRKRKISFMKIILISSCVLIIVLPLFYLLLNVIGQSTKNNLINYITFYVGSSIPSFDSFISNNFINSINNNYFGEHTFIGIQQILNKFNMIAHFNIYQSEWVAFGNGLNSNVFTGVKTYIQDFGISGVIIFETLFGIIYSFLYNKSKYSNYKYLIFYGLIGITLFDQFRSEKVFNSLIRIDTMVYIISIILVTYFLFNFKFERNNKKSEKK